MTSGKGASMDAGGTRRQGQGQSLETRKPSFKCGGPGTRVTYRSVRALTNQFDLMSGQPRIKSKPNELPAVSEQSCLAVKTAINMFEKASPPAARPVAAIKPICKIVQPKPKPKLVPKDSLCRPRYNDMRRSNKAAEVKPNKGDAAEQSCETDMIKMNNCVKKKEQSQTPDPNAANWEECAPYTVQLRKQLSEKSLEALKDRLGKENISVETPAKENIDNQLINNNQTNYSSVFNRISQTRINRTETKNKKERTFVALLNNKEPASEEKPVQIEEQQIKTPTENIKPNMSFLWSAKTQTEPSPEKVPTINDTPLPKPPENFITDCFYESIGETELKDSQDIYDDIGVSSSATNGSSSLYCISDQLDIFNIYEDIANIYESGEDMKNGHFSQTDEVYEHVCEDAVYGDAVYHSICGESEQSSYEKNNSLYESADPAAIASIGSELGLMSNALQQVHPDEDSTSDEWLEESDSEPEQFQTSLRSSESFLR